MKSSFVLLTSLLSDQIMPKKCILPGCKSNYDSCRKRKYEKIDDGDKENTPHMSHIPVYRFPSNMEEKKRWIDSIPLIDRERVSKLKEPVLCMKHWPVGFPTTTVNGKPRPINPPSVFEGVPLSQIPTPPPKPRTTTKATYDSRTRIEDEIDRFLAEDRINWETICSLGSHINRFEIPMTSYSVSGTQWLQSNEFISGIPRFSINISQDFSYNAFHMGIKCTITTLARNRMYKLNTWSRIEEAVRFLQNKEESRQEKVLHEQMKCMEPGKVGEKVYTPEVMMRAFEYFATSRSLYGKLRKDFKLPSEKILSSLTSKVDKLSDGEFLKNVMKNLKPKQRKVTIMIDEIYVKTLLLYHAGTLFGKAVNDPSKLAKAVLSFMIKCPFGGPSFMFKMIPVTKMNADFLHQQVMEIIQLITEAGGKTRVIIVDGNRTNQSLFKKFDTVPGKFE